MSASAERKTRAMSELPLYERALRLHAEHRDGPLPTGGGPYPRHGNGDRDRAAAPPWPQRAELADILAEFTDDPAQKAATLHVRLRAADFDSRSINETVKSSPLAPDPVRARETGGRLVRQGADRRSVRCGLAILTATAGPEDAAPTRTIGLLATFTGPAAAALSALAGSAGPTRSAGATGSATPDHPTADLLWLAARTPRRHLPAVILATDTLTASRTPDRHLSALDFCENVLRAEVIGGLAELALFLGSRIDEDRPLPGPPDGEFTDYAAHLRDRQGILSYEDARLRDYRVQTSDRLRRAQRTVGFASTFLLTLGACLLLSALGLSLLNAFLPGRVSWQLPTAIGTLGAGQIITLFFTRPVRSVQDALAEETIYRMILESRSLKVALTRHYVITENAPAGTGGGTGSAERYDALQRQLDILERIDAADFDRLQGLGVAPLNTRPGTPPGAARGRPRRRRNG